MTMNSSTSTTSNLLCLLSLLFSVVSVLCKNNKHDKHSLVAPLIDCGGSSNNACISDVIIIGSGWAGLAATNELGRPGNGGTQDVVMLETYGRIGGRSHTLGCSDSTDGICGDSIVCQSELFDTENTTFEEGYPVELGSAWTYQGSYIYKLAGWEDICMGETLFQDLQSLGLFADYTNPSLTPEDLDCLLVDNYKNTFIPFAKSRSSYDVSVQYILDEYFKSSLCNVCTTAYHGSGTPSCMVLTDPNRQVINAMMNAAFLAELGAPKDDAAAEDSIFLLHRGGGNAVRFKQNQVWYTSVHGGGYAKIIQAHLDTEMEWFDWHTQLKLNTHVTKVEKTGDDYVLVTATHNDETVYYKAKAVVTTVQLSVLQNREIEFDPNVLAYQNKKDALDGIGMGILNKCIMYWDYTSTPSWWPVGEVDLQLITEEESFSDDWTYVFNDQSQEGNGNYHVLTAWVGGDAANYWESQSDDAVKVKVMNNLKIMIGDGIPDPKHFKVTRWKNDHGGSYSYNKAGVSNSEELRTTLAQTEEGVFFFAGEATSPVWYGTAVGAYQSGEEAAAAVRRAKLF